MSPKTCFGAFSAVLMAVTLVACSDGQQEATGQTSPQDAAGQELPAGHPPLAQAAPENLLPKPVVSDSTSLSWTKPDSWVEEPPANPMRQAQYRIPSTDGDGQCVAYYFGAGQGGTPVANAQRWADQFTQADGSPSREALKTRELEVNGLAVLMVEVAGTYNEGGMMMTGSPATERPEYMLLGAIVEGPDANWFFKFTGPEETVRANAEQFDALVRSIHGPA